MRGSILARWTVNLLCLAPACECVHDPDSSWPQPEIATLVELQMSMYNSTVDTKSPN